MAKEYANVYWGIEDVHVHRQERGYAEWDDEEAENYLEGVEEKIREAMIEKGWQVLTFEMEGEVVDA
tara:strand:+ start:521 stop:721 length:201 start_codon:yes stop_codon:yes gene_type:complete